MDRTSRVNQLPLAIILIVLLVISLHLQTSSAQSVPNELPQIVERLISAYNNQDAEAYRRAFSEKLKEKFSLEAIESVLRAELNSKGNITSHETQISPDGKRALVLLRMEHETFDVHIRINNQNQIERLKWFPHKEDPSTNSLSGHEQHLIREKYQPYVDMFVQAIRDTNAELVMSLMVKDEDDEMTLEDHRAVLIQMNNRGLKEVGEIEILAPNKILVPIYFEEKDMGFYMDFDNENKISSLRITNYAPSVNKGMSYSVLGEDTLRTSVLTSFDQLREAFDADSGKVRFVALLAPT